MLNRFFSFKYINYVNVSLTNVTYFIETINKNILQCFIIIVIFWQVNHVILLKHFIIIIWYIFATTLIYLHLNTYVEYDMFLIEIYYCFPGMKSTPNSFHIMCLKERL